MLAQRIKDAVRQATGLSCSIGIAPNKLLAKISSELEKPNGLTVITEADIPSRIWPLAARKVNGIGPKAAEKLTALGINTIGELAATDPAVLQDNFGRTYSEWLMRTSNGLDDRPVATSSETKSISRETTFERDLHAKLDRDTLTPIFTDLCVRLAGDLQRKGYVTRTVGIKLRFSDFRIVTRDLTLPAATDDASAIRQAAGECLRRVALDRRLRLLGVRASALTRKEEAANESAVLQGELFGSE